MIDMIGWKEFRIGDYFDVAYGKFVPKGQEGNTPFVTTTGTNNGIGRYINEPPMYDGNCITVASDGSMGASFYQEKPFSAINIVSTLKPRENVPLNRHNAQFLCTLLYEYGQRNFSWAGFKFSVDRAREAIIPMPSVIKAVPDWDFLNNLIGGGTDMSSIDTSSWKEFKCKDLFGEAKLGKYHNPNSLVEDENGYEFICASGTNNGINSKMPRVNGKNICLTSGHVIAWGKQCPNFTYHKNPCVTSQGMYYIETGDIPESAMQYLCSILNKAIGNEFDYTNCLTGEKFDEITILLPAKTVAEPDWAYMESYMKEIEKKAVKAVDAFQTVIGGANDEIDTSAWGEFEITDLFDLSLPKGDLQVKHLEEGLIPLITPSAYNNGLLQRISADSKSTIYPAGCMTVDMFGNAYYQDENFFVTAHGHVNVLVPKSKIDKYVGNFVATAIKTMFMEKYGFSDMCTQKVLKAETISLPIDQNGDPDWQYMEDYMKAIETRVSVKLNTLLT